MSTRRAVVVSLQGLSPAALEPYGCSWLHTEAFNRLASQSLVCERCIADSLLPDEVLCSLATGQHVATRRANSQAVDYQQIVGVPPLDAVLITDDPEISRIPIAQAFGQHIISEPSGDLAQPVTENIEDTSLGQLFAQGMVAATDPEYRLVWVHATSLVRYWDAPAWLSPPDEERVPDATGPPTCLDAETIDPDELLGWMNLYGRQVRLLDLLIGLLLDAIDNATEIPETMLVVTATESIPLGERGVLGMATDDCSSPRVHLPLFVRTSGNSAAVRLQRCCQSHEVARTIQRWLAGEVLTSQDSAPGSDLLAAAMPDDWAQSQRSTDWALTLDQNSAVCAFLTPHWNLLQTAGNVNLYRKPDDRFDVNDIASRAPEVVTLLREHAASACASLAHGADRPSLSDELLSGMW